MSKKIFYLVITILIMFIAVGCSKDSPVDPTSEVADIIVQVTNENGEPVPDAIVSTFPLTITSKTDESGVATIKGVFPRSYNVIVNKEGCPTFNKYIKLDDVGKENVTFIIYSEITVIIKDTEGRLIQDASITTNPATESVITNDQGQAVFHDVPERTYQFTIQREKLAPLNFNIVIDDNSNGQVEFSILSEKPVVEIIEPSDKSVFGLTEISLTGAGSDYEDGDLPEDTFTWISNIDGEIGTGKNITPSLSEGNHLISLQARDSDDNFVTTRISLVVVNYDPNSYFPLVENISWEYNHNNPTFIVVNSNNVNELWEIIDLTTTVTNNNRRISTAYYDITIGTVVKHLRYMLTDFFEEEDNAVYVSFTTEKTIEWKSESEENSPYVTVNVSTSYSPRHLIINNIMDPRKDLPIETTTRVETEWTYTYFNTTSDLYHESYTLETTIKPGVSQFIQIDKGLFKADEIIYESSDEERSWWLTKGVGLIQLDYQISDFEQTALLFESDLLDFYRAEKPAMRPAKKSSAPYPPKTFKLNRETGEGWKDIFKHIRTTLVR
ncbi:carboxypeptidase-like regulatory domain-containing protein [Candidatus Latescibacterota bacterium]